MSQRHKPAAARDRTVEQAMRDEEVLRANRELAAYFKGRRTEREARAALKIIKAFVRDRERRDAKTRPPLPGGEAARSPKKITILDVKSDKRRGRKSRRKSHGKFPTSMTASVESQRDREASQPSKSDEQTSE